MDENESPVDDALSLRITTAGRKTHAGCSRKAGLRLQSAVLLIIDRGRGLFSLRSMDLIWDTYQQGQISSANETATRAANKADTVANELGRLSRRIERLSLCCQALWELSREKHGLTEEELQNRILQIDLRDGTTDGKMQTQIVDCPNCRSKTNTKRAFCVICGVPLPAKHAFEV